MPGLSSIFTYDIKASTAGSARYRDVRNYRHLTSRTLVLLFLLLLSASIIVWLLQSIYPAAIINLNATSLLLGSLASAAFLAILFGLTFFPCHRLPINPAALMQEEGSEQINIATAASWHLLMTLGSQADSTNPDVVNHSLQRLLNAKVASRWLDRLELSKAEALAAITTQVLPSLTWGDVAYNALNIAKQSGAPAIGPVHMLAVFFLHPKLQPYLRQHALRETDIWFIITWFDTLEANKINRQRWWSKDNLFSFSGVGLSWISGYTPFIDRFTRVPSGNLWDTAFTREVELDELITSLTRQEQHNVLLVGHPGVGRLGIVKELQRRLRLGQAGPALKQFRLVYIHVSQLLSLAGTGPQQLQIVSRALEEMDKAGNVIAVLDGVGSLLGEGASSNGSDLLSPFFSSKNIHIVVMMTPDEYHLRIEGNDELAHLFDIIHIEPLSTQNTLQLLALATPVWEKSTGQFIPYPTLREAVQDTEHIFPQIPFPEKAFDIVEEALAHAQRSSLWRIEPADIQALIANRLGIQVGTLASGEDDKLSHLEDAIHRRVINQEKAVAAISRAMIRARAGVRTLSRPIGSFLFLGPTGVGKTETAKALAEAYFGSQDFLQRLDMSEYQTEDGLERLIGTFQQSSGRLTQMISDNPFSVLLLDEFEKAHLSVQQLFLQILDEGRLSDARGRAYSFKHAIIIATSNAGAEFIREHVGGYGTVPEGFAEDLKNYLLSQNIYRPELLNRFDGVITFVPLTPDHIQQVARLMLNQLNQRLDSQHGITVAITDELINFLVQIGYSPQFGARPMARAIQNTVEYAVAEMVVNHQFIPGTVLDLPIAKLTELNRAI